MAKLLVSPAGEVFTLAKVERGELGVKSSHGFYTYPDPECARDDFLLSGTRV
jgi:3-hydroxyacyl-CoA dehydrogenase